MGIISSSNFSNSSFWSTNIFSRRNDKYTTTPNLFMNFLNLFNKTEQWVSIDGRESEILKTTPQLNAVIYKRAEMVANGRWKHYGANGDEIENSKVVKLLNRPNPLQSRKEWIIQNDIQKSCYGNSLTYMLRGSSLALPSALWNLSPQYVTIDRTGLLFNQTDVKDIITAYKLNYDDSTGKAQMTMEPHEIMHRNIQDIDDPLLGTSPFHALKMPISNIRAAYGFRNVIITEKGALGILSNNSKNSSGAIPLSADERKKIDEAYTRNYGITDKQRKIIMSNASLQWQAMSYPTKDLMLFEEISDDFRIIIDKYGMDEALFSVGGPGAGTTFENKNMAEKRVYEDTIIPEGEDLANSLSYKLGLEDKGERLELDYSHLAVLQEDQVSKSQVQKNKAETAKTMKESDGLWTDEEIREVTGLVPN